MKYQTYYLSLIEKILIKCQIILKDTKPKKINVKKNELKINLDYKLNKAICEELRKTKIDIISEENNSDLHYYNHLYQWLLKILTM